MGETMPLGLRFSLLHRSFKKRMDRKLAELELTGVQFGVLGCLVRREQDGREETSQRDLEEAFHMSHATMTDLVQRLEKKGFISSQRSSRDRRSKSLRATEKAYSLKQAVKEVENDSFRWLSRGLTEQQIQELLDITRNIFPLSDKREDTFIAGFSMGGYGAIRNGLKYSQNFSKIGMISAALITDDIVSYADDDNVLRSRSFYESVFGDLDKVKNSDKDPEYLIENCDNIPDIFMACGVDDFLYDKNVRFYEFLRSKGIKAEFIEAPGEHTWEFSEKFIKEFIKTITL
jgi:DNA-binding MarR family transcriptional regulator